MYAIVFTFISDFTFRNTYLPIGDDFRYLSSFLTVRGLSQTRLTPVNACDRYSAFNSRSWLLENRIVRDTLDYSIISRVGICAKVAESL